MWVIEIIVLIFVVSKLKHLIGSFHKCLMRVIPGWFFFFFTEFIFVTSAMVNKGFFLSIFSRLWFKCSSFGTKSIAACSFLKADIGLAALIWVAFPGLRGLQMLVWGTSAQRSGVLHWPTTFQGAAFYFSSLPPFTLFSSLLFCFWFLSVFSSFLSLWIKLKHKEG